MENDKLLQFLLEQQKVLSAYQKSQEEALRKLNELECKLLEQINEFKKIQQK